MANEKWIQDWADKNGFELRDISPRKRRPREPGYWFYLDREHGPKCVQVHIWEDGHLAIVTWRGPMRISDVENEPWFVRWLGEATWCGCCGVRV